MSANPSFSLSLPLMGIGNAVETGAVALGYGLITPHGDRKPAETQHGVPAADAATSLPLMGIGNPIGGGAASPSHEYRRLLVYEVLLEQFLVNFRSVRGNVIAYDDENLTTLSIRTA